MLLAGIGISMLLVGQRSYHYRTHTSTIECLLRAQLLSVKIKMCILAKHWRGETKLSVNPEPLLSAILTSKNFDLAIDLSLGRKCSTLNGVEI